MPGDGVTHLHHYYLGAAHVMRAQRHARKVAAMTEEVSVLKDKALEEEEIAGTGEPVVFKPNKQLKAQNAQKRKEAEERAKQQILKEQADKLKAQMQRAAARAAHLAEVCAACSFLSLSLGDDAEVPSPSPRSSASSTSSSRSAAPSSRQRSRRSTRPS